MTIRHATRKDVASLVALNRHVQQLHAKAQPSLFVRRSTDAAMKSAFRRLLQTKDSLWLIAEERSPLGYLFAQLHRRPSSCFRHAQLTCNICHIAVSPAARRRGIARGLLNHLVKEAAARGCERIELDVWSFNHEAKAAFSRLGFKVFNERMVLA
jgi:ribosomal protein S18 acetylase RimI-like enzyme